MATPTAPLPCDTEEPSTIPDQIMVFRSNVAPPVLKSSKARIKTRKCTPAPTTKGDGRKRLTLSPFLEDKQLRKKINFGDEHGSAMVEPRCKGAIFPVTTSHGVEACSKQVELESKDDIPSKSHDMAIVCYVPPITGANAPDSGEAAGGSIAGGRTKDNMVEHFRSRQEESNIANEVLGGDIVNFSKMDQGTNVLLESALDDNSLSESHDGLAVEGYL